MKNLDRYDTIGHSRRGRVLTLTLNRPETLNAIGADMHRELAQIFIDAADDPDSDVIVLTGAGRAFSSGGDLQWMQSMLGIKVTFVPFKGNGPMILDLMAGRVDIASASASQALPLKNCSETPRNSSMRRSKAGCPSAMCVPGSTSGSGPRARPGSHNASAPECHGFAASPSRAPGGARRCAG